MFKAVITTVVMALSEKQKNCSSDKTTTVCGDSSESLQLPTKPHSRGCESTYNKVLFTPPTMCRLTPYCSIIDQTVEKFTEILGEENVLAHYSEAEFEEMDNEGEDVEKNPKILATENWDKPVVVTTAVQFFESLFACRTSKCRKLHNIANAVVIFDEAQTLPKPYLKPCIAAIMELACNYRTSCVFCTATQPALDRYIGKYLVDRKPADYEIEEICQGTEELYQSFKRVTYRKLGLLTDEQLAERLSKCDQVLCIVTTRRQAEQVYHLLPQEETCHLSKCMTSEHIKSVLKTIHERLDAGKTMSRGSHQSC